MRALVVAIVLLVATPVVAAPPPSLVTRTCGKAGSSELLAVWPIAGTNYFLVLAVFDAHLGTPADIAAPHASSILDVVEIDLPRKHDDDPYKPSAAAVARARAIVASCKRLQVHLEPQSSGPPHATWTFTDGTGATAALLHTETVDASPIYPVERARIDRCAANAVRGKPCDGEGSIVIGAGARRIYRHVIAKNERIDLDQVWVGPSKQSGPLFESAEH